LYYIDLGKANAKIKDLDDKELTHKKALFLELACERKRAI